MAHISFYRKWRPKDFDEIIGQENITKTLKNAISHNRLSHAYLFCGPRGTGKTSTSRILAKAINCVHGPTPTPCNVCGNCVSISNNSSVDVIEIDAASNRGIDEIRELRDKVKYLPNILRKKIYIIDEVHMLTDAAFNALLKTLEEPPEHAVFILATTEPHKVLPTIMSRCQRFDFIPISFKHIVGRLIEIAKNEDIDISESALNLIAKYSGGSQRDADVILEKLSSIEAKKINVEDVSKLLGVLDLEILFDLAAIIFSKNIKESIFFEKRLFDSNINIKIFIEEFLNHLYILYVIKNYDNPWDIIDVNEDYKQKYIDQEKEIDAHSLSFYIDLFSELYKNIRQDNSLRAMLRYSLIKAVSFHLDAKNIHQETIGQTVGMPKQHEVSSIAGAVEKKVVDKKADKPVLDKKEDDVKKLKKDPTIAAEGKEKIPTGSEMEVLKEKWDEIIAALSDLSSSLKGQFIEVKKFRIDADKAYFYLPEKFKWHKEQLNKIDNIKKISDVFKKVLNKNYAIEFMLIDEDGKQAYRIKDSYMTADTPKAHTPDEEFVHGEEQSLQEQRPSDHENNFKKDKESNIIDYFKEKFNTKE
jgi:DNA polymerase III subunit gamma/tau